jgi:site-specific DNA-methyltransferase (adenine-specific)
MTTLKPDGNYLFYGDNLDVLRSYIPDNCVDLVYLDPPFKSNQVWRFSHE